MSLLTRRQKCNKMIRRYYHNVPSREEMLDRAICENLDSSRVLLDAGCGSDFPLLNQYAPKASMAIGMDLCSPIAKPPAAIKFVMGSLEALPLQSSSVDLIFSRSVIEHLKEPRRVFEQLHHVLRKGGKVVFTTPNKFYYSCVIASLTPERLKEYYFETVFGGGHYDYFPVYYRANTERTLRRLAKDTGFRLLRIEPIRHYPYYLVFSPFLFRLGIAYDHLITALGLRGLQSNWLVVLEKS